MRTLSAALIAAAQTQGSVPDIKLELADMWPHFATVATAAAGGPVAAAIAPDGSVVAAYVSTGVPNMVYVLRVTDPTNAGQWAGWTALITLARYTGQRALAQMAGRELTQEDLEQPLVSREEAEGVTSLQFADALFVILGRVPVRMIRSEGAGVDAEEGDAAGERIGERLEHQRRQKGLGAAIEGDRLSLLVLAVDGLQFVGRQIGRAHV